LNQPDYVAIPESPAQLENPGAIGTMVMSARAQVYQTTPNFVNPTVTPTGSTNQNAYATPVSGNVYASTNRPAESGTKRYQIANWNAGATFSAAAPDFFLVTQSARLR